MIWTILLIVAVGMLFYRAYKKQQGFWCWVVTILVIVTGLFIVVTWQPGGECNWSVTVESIQAVENGSVVFTDTNGIKRLSVDRLSVVIPGEDVCLRYNRIPISWIWPGFF